jgi:hypothetical protein
VTLFYDLKQPPRYELAFGDEEVTGKFLLKVPHGFKQITVDSKTWEAFPSPVFEFDRGNDSDKVLFNTKKLRQLDHLSTQWRSTRFNRISKQE